MDRIFLPQVINVNLLYLHPRNPQKQNKHVFTELRESIREKGFDEPLIVYPKDEGVGYWIISGNHRYQAAKAEGYGELPCIVRDDWTPLQAELEVVRRNYVRGRIDRDQFVEYVDHIAQTYSIPMDELYAQMGFEDIDTFATFYEKEATKEAEIAQEIAKSSEVSMIENVSDVVSHIFSEHGHTVPCSFLIFPLGKRKHMYIEITPGLKKSLQEISMRCVKEGMDINVALGGLLSIGIQSTNFIKGPADTVEVEQAHDGIDGDTDMEFV